MKYKSLNCKGQSLIEYLIIVALVAVGTMGVMRVVSQSVSIKFAEIARSLGADTKDPIGKASVGKKLTEKKDLRNFMSSSVRAGQQSSEENESGD